MYTTKNSWTATHNKNTQTSTTLKCKAFAAKFYTGRVLHQKMLTPQNLLGQRVFSPKCLDQTTFTTEDVTSKRLHQKTFAPESFYRTFLHWGILQQNMFTQCTYYTKQALCIKEFLHQKTLTPPTFILENFFEMLNHKLFTPIHSYSRRL